MPSGPSRAQFSPTWLNRFLAYFERQTVMFDQSSNVVIDESGLSAGFFAVPHLYDTGFFLEQ
jgi:hypothetical protein